MDFPCVCFCYAPCLRDANRLQPFYLIKLNNRLSLKKKAGEQVIEALNRAYGVDTIGLFLKSPRCPDFVEGMFYEDSLPSFRYEETLPKPDAFWKRPPGAEPSGWKPTQSIPLPKKN